MKRLLAVRVYATTRRRARRRARNNARHDCFSSSSSSSFAKRGAFVVDAELEPELYDVILLKNSCTTLRVRTRDKLIKNYIFKYQARYQVQLFETTASSSTLFRTNPRRFEYVFRRRQRVRDREERVIPHHPVTLLLSDSPSPQERRGEE